MTALDLTKVSESEFKTAVLVRGALADKNAEVGIVPALLDGTRVLVYTLPHPQEPDYEVPVAIVVTKNTELFERLTPGESDVELVPDAREDE